MQSNNDPCSTLTFDCFLLAEQVSLYSVFTAYFELFSRAKILLQKWDLFTLFRIGSDSLIAIKKLFEQRKVRVEEMGEEDWAEEQEVPMELPLQNSNAPVCLFFLQNRCTRGLSCRFYHTPNANINTNNTNNHINTNYNNKNTNDPKK